MGNGDIKLGDDEEGDDDDCVCKGVAALELAAAAATAQLGETAANGTTKLLRVKASETPVTGNDDASSKGEEECLKEETLPASDADNSDGTEEIGRMVVAVTAARSSEERGYLLIEP